MWPIMHVYVITSVEPLPGTVEPDGGLDVWAEILLTPPAPGERIAIANAVEHRREELLQGSFQPGLYLLKNRFHGSILPQPDGSYTGGGSA